MKNYPQNYQQLLRLLQDLSGQIPETMQGFSGLHKAALKDGELSTKTKELIALGIAITSRCDGCIAFHIHDALEAGAKEQEVLEAIGVAVMMGGGPAVVYGCEALAALRQFELDREQNVV